MDFKNLVHKAPTRRASHGFESPWGHRFLAPVAIILIMSVVTEIGTDSNDTGTNELYIIRMSAWKANSEVLHCNVC